MNRTVSRMLVELGTTWNLKGGFNAWQEEVYPMAGAE